MKFFKVLGAAALPFAALSLSSCGDDAFDLNAESIAESVVNTLGGLANSQITFKENGSTIANLRMYVTEIDDEDVEIGILDGEYAIVSDEELNILGTWSLDDDTWERDVLDNQDLVEETFELAVEAGFKLGLVLGSTVDELFDQVTVNDRSIELTTVFGELTAYFDYVDGDLVITSVILDDYTTKFNFNPAAVPQPLITAITEYLTTTTE